MNYREFGRTGWKVSEIGWGGAPAAFLNTDRQSAVNLVNSLLDSGVNLLDTAAMYPGSEQFIGENFAHRRGDYILVSKCGTKVAGIDETPWSPQLISASVDRALKLTKSDHLDVMLLHSCDLATLKKGEALAALVKARDAGKVRFVGYSGDNDAAAFAAALPDIAVIETSINIVDQINIDKVLPVARTNRVGVIIKRPIANAAWKPLSDQKGMYASYAKIYTDRFAKLGLSISDLGFTGDPAIEWPRVALRFALSFPDAHVAIVGTTRPENAAANLRFAAEGPLPESVVAKIRDAFRKADPDGSWSGQT
jgi:aryl-alcohol dehydrogenase-like predicted oxidoreductase